MLVLSRKEGEEIVIGDDIRVTISKISGSRIRVAIDAPDQVSIRRGELEFHGAQPVGQDGRGNSEASSLHVAAYHA